MSKTSERDVEKLLRNTEFSNSAHKEALRACLFGDMQVLELDDLAMAAGGVTLDRFVSEDWKEKQP